MKRDHDPEGMMTDLRRPVPETITVRPALACSLSGLTLFELRNFAEPECFDGAVPIRAVRSPVGTEYRLDDVLELLGTMADLGLLNGTATDEEVPF